MDKIGIIDLGTNTFHLLVAERVDSQYTIIYQNRVPAKVGMGGINQNIITEEGVERAIKAISDFQTTLKEMGVEKVMAFGTSALRSSNNGNEVIQKIKNATGIETKIISGEEEAELIYLGVRAAVKLGKEKSLIVDIGGGSVEFIIGNDQEIFWKHSFDIGAQRLLEKFQKHDPISSEEIKMLDQFFDSSLQPLLTQLGVHLPKTLVGSSGTFDTLSDIYCSRNNIQQQSPETPLTIVAFYEIFEELIVKNRPERMKIAGMIEMRVDMIVVACCLIDFLLKRHSFSAIRVSSYSLKEGVLATLFASKH